MRNSLLKFALVASLLLNLTVVATAGYNYYRHARTWQTPFEKVAGKDRFLFEELSLSPDQLNAMKSKAVLFHHDMDSRRQEIDKTRKELIALLRAEHPDQRAIDAVIKDINTKQEGMQRMVAGHLLEIKAVLDKDQRQKFFDLIEGTMNKIDGPSCMPREGAMH